MRRFIAAGLVLSFAAGCASQYSVVGKTAVAAMQTLTLAETTYVTVCKSAPTIVICVDPMKQTIKDADLKAYNAVKAALTNEALADAAWKAVTVFTDLAK